MGGVIFSILILVFMSITNENSKINLILIGNVMISWVGFMMINLILM